MSHYGNNTCSLKTIFKTQGFFKIANFKVRKCLLIALMFIFFAYYFIAKEEFKAAFGLLGNRLFEKLGSSTEWNAD